jgi:hypothetical protein
LEIQVVNIRAKYIAEGSRYDIAAVHERSWVEDVGPPDYRERRRMMQLPTAGRTKR